jgi:cytochrome c
LVRRAISKNWMKRITLAALFVAATLGQASAQDAAAGEKVFLVCRACHQVGDNAKNAVGPVSGETK